MASDVKIDKRKLERLIRNHPEQADRWLRGVGQQMAGDIKQSMLDSPASGETYSRGQDRTHTASAPGNPPRPDMGTLINSIRVRDVRHLHYEVVDGVEYGILLEEGTERMGARPFMRPTFDAWRRKIGRDAKDKLLS